MGTFMVQFYRAIQNPVATVGYSPKNDLIGAFKSRWINGINTFVPAKVMEQQLLHIYRDLDFFKGIHIFCGEWHPKPEMTPEDFKADVKQLTQPPGDKPFIGVSFFQYQVAYNKEK